MTNVAFRVDAASVIGIGHLMRCLALAGALRERGCIAHFICRSHPGHLGSKVLAEGHELHLLPQGSKALLEKPSNDAVPPHAGWLGEDWQTDLKQTRGIIAGIAVDWLVVDHYGLDHRWERSMRDVVGGIMVIDDLADRCHDCDILLDQTYGIPTDAYTGLIPDSCRTFIGARYAILRPEFAALRPESLQRRRAETWQYLLITMGGVDPNNVTGSILENLDRIPWSRDRHVTVVMGAGAPWLQEIERQAAAMHWPIEIKHSVTNMAQLMAQCDLCIGAAGGTTWERCCLGLPTLMLAVADNQREIAWRLDKAQAAILVQDVTEIEAHLRALDENPGRLQSLSQASANMTDGRGTKALIDCLNGGGQRMHQEQGFVRRMTEQDLNMVLRWRNHIEVRRYMFTQHEIDAEEHRRWFERASGDENRRLLIFELMNEPCGFIHFTMIGRSHGADWGFYLNPDAGKGLGQKLGTAALDYAFQELKLHKVCGQAIAFNERSINFHLRQGFKQEGTLRDQHFDGQNYQDVLCFGLLSHEWNNKNRAIT